VPKLPWTALALVAAIVLLGAVLRFWGLDAGAPFRTGVDEPVILSTALRIVKTGDFHPHFFDYGGLTLYLHAAVGSVAFLVGASEGRWTHLDALWEGDLLVPGRIATALLSTLTIVLVFRIGLRWGRAAGIIAALAMAVLPAHVREAHFVLTDTPLTLFVTLALLLSIRAAEQGRVPSLAVAGIAVGLATAVKYNGVIALMIPGMAALALPRGRRAAGLSATVATTAATFLVFAPYTVLDLPAFLNGMAHLMQSYNQDRPLFEAMSTYLAYLRNWFTWPGVLPAMVGYLALLVAATGFLTMLARRDAGPNRLVAALVVAFPLVYFWFVSTQSLQYGRYLLPIGPMLCVGLAAGLTAFAPGLQGIPPLRRLALPVLTLLVLAPPTATAISWDRTHTRTTTAEQAARWILDHSSAGHRTVSEVPMQLPPGVGLTVTPRLVARTIEQYRSAGVTYLIGSSNSSDLYYANPAANSAAIAAHRTLLALTEPVATFVPSPDHPGAVVTIRRVPQSVD
jgi:4-amino-4-deoxy-L-arabinose transferase-like glycosyltransferase